MYSVRDVLERIRKETAKLTLAERSDVAEAISAFFYQGKRIETLHGAAGDAWLRIRQSDEWRSRYGWRDGYGSDL